MTDERITQSRALRALEGECAPKLRGRDPFWRPKPPAIATDVYTPAWDWMDNAQDDAGEALVILDAIAAYVTAISSVTVAHGALEHTGPVMDATAVGYYLITIPAWEVPGIVHPLGTDIVWGDQVWVAHPTAQLLQQLAADGYAAALEIHDSWTAPTSVRLRKWSDILKARRNLALDEVDAARAAGSPELLTEANAFYTDLKISYSIAVQMMLTGEKCKTRRPDWAHAIVATHSANIWRKVWRCVLAGKYPAGMGAVDEVAFTWTTFHELMYDIRGGSPLKVDPTGRQLGAFKVKDVDNGVRPIFTPRQCRAGECTHAAGAEGRPCPAITFVGL